MCFHCTLFRLEPVKEARFFKASLDVMADPIILTTFFNTAEKIKLTGHKKHSRTVIFSVETNQYTTTDFENETQFLEKVVKGDRNG